MKDQILKVLGGSKPKHLWITGHSLGGALALVCAYDLVENEKAALDGVITFGQPLVAQKQLADYLDRLLLGRYAHFVNETDIVPRVPPSPFVHCGSLVWFKGNGIKRSKPKHPVMGATAAGPASSGNEEEIAPLSKEEFENAKAKVREEHTQPERLPDGRLIVKGNLPFLLDHSMGLYINKVRNLLGISKNN